VVENEKNLNTESAWWRPVMVFYGKTTSWVILPLILAILLGKYFSESNQILFFILIMIGFGITCFGIYSEIKEYKKRLAEEEKNGNK